VGALLLLGPGKPTLMLGPGPLPAALLPAFCGQQSRPTTITKDTMPRRVLPAQLGTTGRKAESIAPRPAPITVGGELRGDDWGKGRAAEQFAALREAYNSIPKGRHTEHELREVLAAWRARQREELK
jgi:hypothetical protein